ncbi:MAG: tetratricopeptide repeat protein [Magnetococcales bacterium]|nr:tetratricopeptide repeat protein [Magnetococcales bacterium]
MKKSRPSPPRGPQPTRSGARSGGGISQEAIQWFQRGNDCYNRVAFADAIACYQQALQLAPRADAIYCNLGSAYWASGAHQPAMQAWQQAATINPNSLEAHNNLGNGYRAEGNFTAASNSYRRALALSPGSHAIHNNLASLLALQGQPAEACHHYRYAMEQDRDNVIYHSNYLFDLNYADTISHDELFQAHVQYGQRFDPIPRYTSWIGDRQPDRPLRIGYLSGDFCESPVGFLIEPVLMHHDRSQFIPIGYTTGKHHDSTTQRIQASVAQWRDVRGITAEALAQRIREDAIDILVDLAGHTAANRLPAFARKPAPVQLSYAGYINTTGLKAIDYYVGDAVTLPAGSESWFSESLLRLSCALYCYRPPDYTPAVASAPCLHHGFVTFGSFNKMAKLTPFTIDLWIRILLALPEARLAIKDKSISDPEFCRELRNRFQQQGIDGERLLLWPHNSSLQEHLLDFNRIDIQLDPHPFNGGMTTLQSLWQGVPVVTLLGTRHASRVGASLLTTAGLADLTVADGADDYVAKAVSLASDRSKLAQLRAGLREQIRTTSLVDGALFTRCWQEMLITAWHRYCKEPVPS